MPAPAGQPIRLRVRVQPRASRAEVRREPDGTVRVWVQAPPVDGAANAAVIALLADKLGVSKGNVAIIQGASSQEKVVAIAGLAENEVRRRLGG